MALLRFVLNAMLTLVLLDVAIGIAKRANALLTAGAPGGPSRSA